MRKAAPTYTTPDTFPEPGVQREWPAILLSRFARAWDTEALVGKAYVFRQSI